MISVYPFLKLGKEFMPPLYEGDLLYMPTTLPNISIGEVKEILQQTDRIIKTFPEVESVLGKAGRALTATDPAPISMLETTIRLKPKDQWRDGVDPDSLVRELDAALKFPGITNSWTMPIKNRIDMQTTGIKTPLGIKIMGNNLDSLQILGRRIEAIIKPLEGTRSVFTERLKGGNYIHIDLKRDVLAAYQLSVKDVQEVISLALGGMQVGEKIEGREKYAITLRYDKLYRDDLTSLENIRLSLPMGGEIPLSYLAEISLKAGISELKTENARPSLWVYVDLTTTDLGGYVEAAKKIVQTQIKLPLGYSIIWSGQYEYIKRADEKLMWVIPLALFFVIILMYLSTKSWTKTSIVLLALPFSAIGAMWYLYLAGFQMSVAVWVGLIALFGVDAETGVVMLLYLDIAYENALKKNQMNSALDLKKAIIEGAVLRIRPKLMTVLVDVIGLLPILISTDTGNDVMKRIAAPLVGGMFSSLLLELTVYPAIFYVTKIKSIPLIK